MYRLDDPEIANAFIGRTLKCISVLVYQVRFEFEGGIVIDCEHQVVTAPPHADAITALISHGAEHFSAEAPPEMFALLERSVASSEVSEDRRDLRIVFDNDTCLTFLGDCDMYECYSIYQNGDRTIV